MSINLDSLTPFAADLSAASVDVFGQYLQLTLMFEREGTYNVAGGIQDGLGPRPGMAPLPGHMDQYSPPTSSFAGMACAELASGGGGAGSGLYGRRKFYGIIPMRLRGTKSNVQTVGDYYLWAVTDLAYDGSTYVFDLVFNNNDGYDIGTDITKGLLRNSAASSSPSKYELVCAGSSGQAETLKELLTCSQNYLSMAVIAVNGADVPHQWYVGTKYAAPDATHAPTLYFDGSSGTMTMKGGAPYMGNPSEYVLQNYPSTRRSLTVWALDANCNYLDFYYLVGFDPTSSIFRTMVDYDSGLWGQLEMRSTVTAKSGAGVGYASCAGGLVYDEQSKLSTGYKAVLVAAGGKPIACVLQDWDVHLSSATQRTDMQKWCDLSSLPFNPRRESSAAGTGTLYSESGQLKDTCWHGLSWPSFTRGTTMVTDATTGIGLGAANTGILRANTVYEVAYSVFNKKLNIETNVGVPAKIQTGSNDYVNLCLFDKSVTGTDLTPAALMKNNAKGAIQDPTLMNYNNWRLNDIQYRIYYRIEGMPEWLPALFIDAPKYWFYPFHAKLTACTGGIGGLPGGRPGGFVDYSTLPAEKYNCVVNYRNRAFWFTEKAFYFSLTNNIFAYPQRNSVAAPDGGFRGALVHTFNGQLDQRSRLIVFGGKGSYIGTFTGAPQKVPLQISVDTFAEFEMDGTDFILDPWTSVTAFSYRAAVVAEGELYFWGPDGIRYDNGTENPDNIGQSLEPDLHTLYDPSKTDEIHAVYNAQMKQITWFYPPKTADGYATHAIVYDLRTGQFLPQKFSGKIDSAQTLDIKGSDDFAGKRTIVSQRVDASGTIQRPYFWDQRCRFGDMRPTTELMVRYFSSPTSTKRLFGLMPGYDAASLATIAVGDYIAVPDASKYDTGLSSCDAFIGKVTGIVGTEITITVPDGVDFASSGGNYDTNNKRSFPLYHMAASGAGLHGITWQWLTKYWLAGGISYAGTWLYLHWLAKMSLLPCDDDLTIDIAHRTPVSTDYETAEVALADNCDGAWQLLHALSIGDRALEGQALKLRVGGVHIGSEWVLQYLSAFTSPIGLNFLKEFEG